MSCYTAKLIFIILVFVSLSHAVISCGSSVTVAGTNTSSGLNTTGNTLLFVGTGNNEVANFISDSAANYWNYGPSFGTGGGTGPTATIGYVFNPITSASDTIKNLLPNFAPGAAMFGCSGTLTYGPLGINGQNNAGASSFSMGAVTVNNGDLVIAEAVSNGGAYTVSSAAACLSVTFTTAATIQSAGNTEAIVLFYGVMTSSGSCNPVVTFSANTDWSSTVMVFPGGAVGSNEFAPAVYGPTMSLIIGQPVTGQTSSSSSLNLEADSCTPASVTAGTTMNWPTTPGFTSDGDLIWNDTEGNAIKYYNRHTTSVTRFGITIGAGCTATIAGQANGTVGFNYSTTPIAGLTALLAHPVGLVDPTTNNVYFADQQNHRIVELLSSNGMLFTVAGSGAGTNGTCTNGSFSGDGGLATSATLNCPQDVYLVPGQYMVITDANNHRIRYVNLTGSTVNAFGVSNICAGCITTIVGGGGSGSCSISGSGVGAASIQPTGIVGYNGIIIWTDAQGTATCPRVLQLSASGIISPFAGNGTQGVAFGAATTTAEFCRPMEVRVDNNGVVYVSDSNCAFIAEIRNGQSIFLAGNTTLYGVSGGFSRGGVTGPSGPARTFGLQGVINGINGVGPVGATPDNLGNLWITDTGFNRILEMNLPCYASCLQ